MAKIDDEIAELLQGGAEAETRTEESEQRFRAAYEGAVALISGLPARDAFDVVFSLVATMAVNSHRTPAVPDAQAVIDLIAAEAKELVKRERGKEH